MDWKNNDSYGTYGTCNLIRLKTSKISSIFCDYSNAHIRVKGTITISNTEVAGEKKQKNKKITFENCAPFAKCIDEINNTEVDYAQDIDVVMSMYNLIEYSDVYSKTSGGFW